MNLKLYGICFKVRGGPDLLDYVQTNTPVPVDIMEQVMTQMNSITQEEKDFAEKLDNDWKKALNERVPLLMSIAPHGGYDITCDVPDELLNTVRLLHGMENEKIVEEYTASYLKDVCGVDVNIISVDVEQGEEVQVKTEIQQGFDLSDLGADPDEPTFEDVSQFTDMDADIPVPAPAVRSAAEQPKAEETAYEESVPEEDDILLKEDYPDSEEFPDADEEFYEDEPQEDEEQEDVPQEVSKEDIYKDAVKNIYKELVGNIREKKLDERLHLQIGSN